MNPCTIAAPRALRPLGRIGAVRPPRRPLPVAARRSTVSVCASADYVKDESFSITKLSFGSIAAPVGLGLLVYGFGSYFQILPGK